MTLEIGEVVKDRYRIIQILASGGMGIVYRAKDESLGIEVALKEINPGVITSDRMQKTAALLASLHHPNLPRVTDNFQLPQGGQILVMDFVPGEDLKTRIENSGPLSTKEAVIFISSAGSALQYLHSQNPPVIHQDIKPGNIRITPDGHVMLVDFDLMTVIQTEQTRIITEEQGLTPGFAAPEQYNNNADTRSDQYGLAATLFFILTATTLPDALTRASGKTKLPEQHAARLPMDIITILDKALSINPVDRYSDVKSFIDALDSVQIIQSSSPHNPARNQQSKKTGNGKKILLPFFIGLVVIGGLAAAAYFIFPKPRTGNEIAGQKQPAITPTLLAQTATPDFQTTNPALASQTTLIPTQITLEPTIILPTPLGGGSGEFAFVSEKTGLPQVFLGSLESDKIRQLTDISDGACQPHWSPDGLRLVFTSPCLTKQQLIGKPEPYSGSGLFILTVEGGNIIPIPSLPGGDFDADWSPDSSSIIFSSLRSKFAQIYLFDIASEKITQLTQAASTNRQPVWSPDGLTIAYNSTRNGPSQIWLMDKDGSNPREFSILANGAAFSPDWSPDGSEILYSQTNSLRLASRKLSPTGNAESVLNDRINFASNPDYSPDGNWILFDSNIDGIPRIYRIARDGTGAEAISPTGEKAYQPDWMPVSR